MARLPTSSLARGSAFPGPSNHRAIITSSQNQLERIRSISQPLALELQAQHVKHHNRALPVILMGRSSSDVHDVFQLNHSLISWAAALAIKRYLKARLSAFAARSISEAL